MSSFQRVDATRWQEFRPTRLAARHRRRTRCRPKRPRISAKAKLGNLRSLQRRCRNHGADAISECRLRIGFHVALWSAPVPLTGARLVFDDNRRSNEDAVVEISHVVVGHAEAARRYRLADRLRLVRTVNAIKRRSEIHGAGAERVVDAAGHVPRQIGPPRQRKPSRPTPMPYRSAWPLGSTR